MSPKSKRAAAWELEDSSSDPESEDPSFPSICFCQVCNAEMDSPEAAKEHMLLTGHKNLEMISSVSSFREESSASLMLFKKNKESDWLDHLRKEFSIIFEISDKNDKTFEFFQSKIVKGMEEKNLSLFDNISLKNEIFTFM